MRSLARLLSRADQKGSKGLSMASSLESNKIAAAVLSAGVIAMLSGFVAELLYHPHVKLEENSVITSYSIHYTKLCDGGNKSYRVVW